MGLLTAAKERIRSSRSRSTKNSPTSSIRAGSERPQARKKIRSVDARPTSSTEGVEKFLPVRLEEEFNDGKYIIKGHLGSGRYSSVWLAENVHTKEYHALKILNSDFYNGKHELFELEVMQKLTRVSANSNHPGRNHVAQIVDHFITPGPGGNHMCMVFKPLGASIARQTTEHEIERLPIRSVKRITQQLLQALDFIHTECQIIHTDISPQNICLELSDPRTVVNEARADSNGDIELTTPSLLHSTEMNVRLNDFGIACFFDRHLTDTISPPLLRAPEITLGAPWDQKVDIFNLGALILQFITGQLPFPGKGQRNTRWCHESDRLTQLIQHFGGEPAVVLENADRTEEFLSNGVDLYGERTYAGDSTALEEFVAGNTVGEDAIVGLAVEEVDAVCDLLRRMLATDPRRREPADLLLKHRWLQD